MKRINLQTTIAKETRKGLDTIARREKLSDHGLPSKGRAIDFLVLNYMVIKAGSNETADGSK
jgi:hypothetical protein